MIKTIMLAALAIVPAVAIASPGSPDEPRQKAVSYADLNLASNAGKRALDRRIKRAAQEVCDQPGRHEPRVMADIRRCEKRAIAQVSERVQLAVAKAERRQQLASL